jgi:hypothetical protein
VSYFRFISILSFIKGKNVGLWDHLPACVSVPTINFQTSSEFFMKLIWEVMPLKVTSTPCILIP